MEPYKLKDGIFWVGAVDRESRLFDQLIPLPDGTSYNAYLLESQGHYALIDSVDPAYSELLFARLEAAGVTTLDYVICNHVEQDHSGSLPEVLKRYPTAQLLCSPKAKSMLAEHLGLDPAPLRPVADGETVQLGDFTIEFIHAPWVHWPETMLTYVRERKTLFPCDFFGSHWAFSDWFVGANETFFLEAAKRYYAEIMMPFAGVIKKHLKRLESYEIELIAPSHGPMIERPALIMDAYRSWVFDPPKNKVVIPYVSMHGSTQLIVAHLAEDLARLGVEVHAFPLAQTDIGRIAAELVDAATLIVGTPTVLGGPHPLAAYVAFLADALRPKVKYISVVGSMGWGGKMVEQLAAQVASLKAEILEPVLVRGLPKEADFAALTRLAETVAAKHAALRVD